MPKGMSTYTADTWADVPGYEGLYRVSSTGRVVNAKRGTILSPFASNQTYVRENLTCPKA